MSELYQNAPSGATRAEIGQPTRRADRQRAPSAPAQPLTAADHAPGIATALDAPPIASGPAHMDSLVLHFWHEPLGMRSAISRINRRQAFWKPCLDINGEERGLLFYVHQPRLEVLPALDQWMVRHKGCISRFDIALELSPSDPMLSIRDLVAWLGRNTILKWRPPSQSLDIGGNIYSVLQMMRKRNSNRDYLLYSRLSKIHPSSQQEKCRFELRFQNSQAVKRERQIDNEQVLPSSLRSLNPQMLFGKHIRFVDMDAYDLAGHLTKIVRSTLDHERQQHRQRADTSPFMDRYRASLPRRVTSLVRRIFDGKAQSLKDQCPKAAKRLRPLRNVLLIPSFLTWPDQNAAIIENAQLNSGNASPYGIEMADADPATSD